MFYSSLFKTKDDFLFIMGHLIPIVLEDFSIIAASECFEILVKPRIKYLLPLEFEEVDIDS